MNKRPRRPTVGRKAEMDPIVISGHFRPTHRPTPPGEVVIPHRSVGVQLAKMVRLPHTVFALPFALVGVVYASFESRITTGGVLLVMVAFSAARFAAMGFNRIIDRDIDAANPRTRARELPSGSLKLGPAKLAVGVATVVFVASAAALNPLCLVLSPLALAWVLAYSYTKRFTSWSHLWLGASLAMAPVGGYLAVTGAWPDPWWILPLLSLGVMTWVAGFDIFYALQDEEFDREHGLHSAVVLLGKSGSILFAKSLHGITIVCLVTFGAMTAFGAVYLVAVAVAAMILTWEHQLVRADDLSRLDAAFFTMNGVMSVVVLLGALADRVL